MSSEDKIAQETKQGASESCSAWLLVAIAIYLARILSWAMSEFWYDEVLTFGNFVLDPQKVGTFEAVFRTYPIANNHILSTAIYAVWTKCLNYDLSSEFLARIPSIIEGLLLIAVVSLHWRKWIGDRIAILGAIAFAISPVFTAFAYQVRGYSLSMLLSATAISGAMECAKGKKALGLSIAFASCLLLPLVIPSNALVAPVIAVVILASTKNFLFAAVPLVGAAIGGSYYFTIWDQFVEASKEPGGWDSSWAVALHLALAFAVHCGVILVCTPFKGEKNANDESTNAKNRHLPLWILLACALTIGGVLGYFSHARAPYPRVFLVFLPIGSFAVLFAARNSILSTTKTIIPLLAIFAVGFRTEKYTSHITHQALVKGESPLNLLQQYYRGSSELRTLAHEEYPEGCFIITDEYDQPTMELYNYMNGRPDGIVVSPNKIAKDFIKDEATGQIKMAFAVAKNPQIAANLLSHAGYGTPEELLDSFTNEMLPDEMRMYIPKVFPDNIRQIYAPPIKPLRNPFFKKSPKEEIPALKNSQIL